MGFAGIKPSCSACSLSGLVDKVLFNASPGNKTVKKTRLINLSPITHVAVSTRHMTGVHTEHVSPCAGNFEGGGAVMKNA